jgi:hypothetical protein
MPPIMGILPIDPNSNPKSSVLVMPSIDMQTQRQRDGDRQQRKQERPHQRRKERERRGG